MTPDTDDLETRMERIEADFSGLVQQHQQALERVSDLENTIAEMTDDRQRLKFRIGKLEELLPDEEDDYQTYSREDKVSLVKSHLMERAYATNGKAAVDYDDVIWSVFDGEPSRDHAYTLMDLAAETDGFNVDTSVRPRELRVDLDQTKSSADFSRATTNEPEEAD